MENELNEKQKLRAAIEHVERENLYLYFLEIDYVCKEIIFCITEKLLWTIVPINPESFQELQHEYYGMRLRNSMKKWQGFTVI